MTNIKIKTKTRLFPYIDNIKLMHNLQIDDESLYFISIREDAEKITKIILDDSTISTSGPLIITDATAGVGGNTISFGMSKKFQYINSIELDNQRYNFLDNNINIYNLKNINIYNGDCLELLDKLYSDIIFFDPPWGGKDYKLKNKTRLNISGQTIENICSKFIQNINIKMIVLKLPLNYDIEYFNNELNNYLVNYIELEKMIIVKIKK
jgi:hypothetical protein